MNQIIQRTWIALLVVALMFGCSVHRLKQAQDSYNQAAQIEAQLSFEETEPTADPLEGASQALRNYRISPIAYRRGTGEVC